MGMGKAGYKFLNKYINKLCSYFTITVASKGLGVYCLNQLDGLETITPLLKLPRPFLAPLCRIEGSIGI